MKRLTGDSDYLCIVGKSSDITTNLNKINALYDLTIHSATVKDDGMVMVIVERKKRGESTAASPVDNFSLPQNLGR